MATKPDWKPKETKPSWKPTLEQEVPTVLNRKAIQTEQKPDWKPKDNAYSITPQPDPVKQQQYGQKVNEVIEQNDPHELDGLWSKVWDSWKARNETEKWVAPPLRPSWRASPRCTVVRTGVSSAPPTFSYPERVPRWWFQSRRCKSPRRCGPCFRENDRR